MVPRRPLPSLAAGIALAGALIAPPAALAAPRALGILPPQAPPAAHPVPPGKDGVRWPTQERYAQAMRNPDHNLRDPALRERVQLKQDATGPVHWSGTFGTVFKGTTPSGRSFAIRVFHPGQKAEGVKEIQFRYERLATYFEGVAKQRKLPVELMPVAFVRDGLEIDGQRLPLLKTPWIEGREVDDWVTRRIAQGRPDAVEGLADNFRTLVRDLQTIGIAHGDLHHRNIKIEADGTMRLLDYDSMFIPEFKGRFNSEVGHPNFQHPGYHFDAAGNFRASERPFDGRMDHFSSHVMYVSLLAIAKDPSLWEQFHNENNLIFEGHRDYRTPGASPVFAALARSPSPRVRALAGKLAEYAKRPASSCPSLEETLAELQLGGAGKAPPATAPQTPWWKPGAPTTPPTGAPQPAAKAPVLWWK
jgi:hypothetical protein